MDVKYPHITVKLIGKNGNAFAILGAVTKALRESKIPEEAIAHYQNTATEGDYNHLLQVTMKTVTVE